MSNFRLTFSGEIKKCREFSMGTKPAFDLQLMKKNYAPQGAEASFTWIKVLVVDPKDFQRAWLVEGGFIAGSGEMSLKSFVKKDETKGSSIEVRCSSFDIDAPYSGVDFKTKADPAAAAPKRHVPAPVTDDEPPF